MAGDPNVVVVMLRRPKHHDPTEMRTDPFWEFGSFGCTRCQYRNLMNPCKLHELTGSRLAFAQGGDAEVRLVHVTPPVRTLHHVLFGEAKWHPPEMPLSYKSAPVLVDNHGGTDVPALIHMIDEVRRSSPVARFASKFRSTRTAPTDVVTQARPVGQNIVKSVCWRQFASDQWSEVSTEFGSPTACLPDHFTYTAEANAGLVVIVNP